MKVIILAGGKGTRISEYTKEIPKPMIRIFGKPILSRIIRLYQSYNFNEIIIAAGYKNYIIKNYYKNKKKFSKVKVVDTGKNTMTGGRILRLKKYFNKNENFFMTYGDGLSNINLKRLKKFHESHKKIATVTTVRPPIRFGELSIGNKNIVKKFEEKPQLKSGWINGGFFVLNYKVFKYIKKDSTLFEREPMERLAKDKNLIAFKHHGFWKCVDTLKDKLYLDEIYKKNKKNELNKKIL
tara:strand:- start:763 stop:1479 length:717 start_codon:yes stop_codon:yes gene_type:complete